MPHFVTLENKSDENEAEDETKLKTDEDVREQDVRSGSQQGITVLVSYIRHTHIHEQALEKLTILCLLSGVLSPA